MNKHVLRQGRDFLKRLNYAKTKIREIYIKKVNTNYISTEDMTNKLQSLRGKTKIKFYKNISDYYNEMKNRNFQTQEDLFSKNDQGISKIYHQVLLFTKILQTKPQVEKLNFNYYDLYYTVIKTGHEIDNVDQYEDDENEYNNFNDIITPNQYVGIKPRETISR